MVDPWDEAARKKTSDRQTRQHTEEQAERERREKLAKQRAAEEAASRAMQEAIRAGVAELKKFMAQRGPAAQRLLRASGGRACVVFGARSSGGSHKGIFLGPDGICVEHGSGGSYNFRSDRIEPTTAEEAVRYFAYHGVGRDDPQRVRTIAQWLTEQLDYHAR